MRRPSPLLLAGVGFALAAAGSCASAPPGPGVPATPSVVRRARLDAVMRSTACKDCHPVIYAEHMENTHGLAFKDPEPRLATRDFHRENCIRCHTPRPMFETGIGMVPIERHHDLEEGNTCMTCHWKAGYDYASFRGGPECREAFDRRAGTVEACATCHRVAGTPEQWQNAPAGKLAGRTCLACHMPMVNRPVAVGETPRPVRSHAFPASRSESQLRRAYDYEAKVEGNEVVVRITNSGAGHNFNTGSIQRAVESLVVVRDGTGREVRRDRQVYKNSYWTQSSLSLPAPSIPPGQTREQRVPLGVAEGTVECSMFFKLYVPVEDGHPDLSRRLEHAVIPFSGVDPAAPPPERVPLPHPPGPPAVSPEDAARPDLLVKFAHPAPGVKEVVVPEGDGPEDIARLVSLLEFPVPGARARARERLLRIGPPAVQPLVRALGHWSDETINEAMALLVELGPVAEPALRAALDDDALYIRYHARKVLGRLGFPGGRDEDRRSLLASLAAPHPLDRRSAADALGLFGDPSAASALRPLLDDEDWDVVAAAAGALARLGDREAVPALGRTLAGATWIETRLDLATDLAALGSPAGIPVLLDGMDYPDDVLRARFFEAFFRATGLHMSFDPEAPRMERLEVIARLRSRWAREGGPGALRPAVFEDEGVRERARDLVETLGGGTDVHPGGDDQALLRSLAAMGSDAVPALVEGLTFPPGFVRKRTLVCEALGRTPDPRAVPALIGALRDPDLGVAEWACWALGRIGDGDAVPALRKYQRRVVAYALSHEEPGAAAETGRMVGRSLEVLVRLGDEWARRELAATGGRAAAAEAPPAPEPASVDEALARAAALREKDLYEDAQAVVRIAETRFGESAPLRLETAWNALLIAEEDMTRGVDPAVIESGIQEARARFDEAVAMDPAVAGRELLEARLLRHEGRATEARAVLEAFLLRAPGDARAHQELGDLAMGESDWPVAEREYARVAEILPEDGIAVLYATEARQWLRRPVAELEAGYLRAVRLLPGSESPVRLLARLHAGDPARALEVLGEAVRLQPKAIWARVFTARVLRTRPEPDLRRAEAVLREALSVAPRHPGAHHELAVVLEAGGRPVEACREELAAVESGPAGDGGEAAEALDRLLRADAVVRALSVGERSRAWGILVARTPGTGRFAFDAARWYTEVDDDPATARRFLNAAVTAEPDNPAYDLVIRDGKGKPGGR